jgi:hypothetical protein
MTDLPIDWVATMKLQGQSFDYMRALCKLKICLTKLSDVLPDTAYDAFIDDMQEKVAADMLEFAEKASQ